MDAKATSGPRDLAAGRLPLEGDAAAALDDNCALLRRPRPALLRAVRAAEYERNRGNLPTTATFALNVRHRCGWPAHRGDRDGVAGEVQARSGGDRVSGQPRERPILHQLHEKLARGSHEKGKECTLGYFLPRGDSSPSPRASSIVCLAMSTSFFSVLLLTPPPPRHPHLSLSRSVFRWAAFV